MKNSLFEFNKENLHILYLIKKIDWKRGLTQKDGTRNRNTKFKKIIIIKTNPKFFNKIQLIHLIDSSFLVTKMEWIFKNQYFEFMKYRYF